MPTADWYFAQADLFRGRAQSCLQMAQRLDGAELFDLHQYSGVLTWDCPVGREFDRQVSGYCTRLRESIDVLRADALGLSAEADDYERRGAAELFNAD
jgi:hypothetical protein